MAVNSRTAFFLLNTETNVIFANLRIGSFPDAENNKIF